MIGAAGLDDLVDRTSPAGALGQLLEAALGALELGRQLIAFDLRTGQPDEPVPRGLPAKIQVDGPGHRLHPRGQEERPVPAAVARLALPQAEMRAQIQTLRDSGEPRRADDRRTARGEDALVIIGMALVQRGGDRKVDHGVSEQLEAFVVALGLAWVLVHPARVGERPLQEFQATNRQAEALRRRPPLRPRPEVWPDGLGGVLLDVVRGVLDGADLLGILIRDLRPELLFEAHDQLDQIEGVSVEVIDERCLRLDLILFDAELADDELLEAIVRRGHWLPPRS